MAIKLQVGDCADILKGVEPSSVDMIYLDPPFFTEKRYRLQNRERTQEFVFDDIWGCHKKYAEFMALRLALCRNCLSDKGSIFVHCDSTANHIIRTILDELFGKENFRSEIIWSYKRWSNAKNGLLPAHQNIYWYSKTSSFKFNRIFNGYSESTNIDQILQKRTRDTHGKSTYQRDEEGKVVLDDEKVGVPLSDVWEIPYLNPKAKERVGYPTQKPILLLERIIELSTDMGDFVLDPFCGSGTTLVAAQLMERNGLGIDLSDMAIELAQNRLDNPVKSKSNLLEMGRDSYWTADKNALALLEGLELNPVHRNKGIDAILKQTFEGGPILIRVQRSHESLSEVASLLLKVAKKKRSNLPILVKTQSEHALFSNEIPSEIYIVESAAMAISNLVNKLTKH
jgi:site-specific DNA-methyltransferase (adenine-specific)